MGSVLTACIHYSYMWWAMVTQSVIHLTLSILYHLLLFTSAAHVLYGFSYILVLVH